MWIVFLLLNIVFISNNFAKDVGERCVEPDGVTNGKCKSFDDCDDAKRSVQSKGSHPFTRCGFLGSTEIVCCPNTRPTVTPTPTRRPTPSDRFNEPQNVRIADIECEKIKKEVTPPLSLHIIGGIKASLGEYPHMVLLGYKTTDDTYDFKCGGSLISTNYALTAAHCIETIERIKPTLARIGTIERGGNVWNDETDVMIDEYITHPNYSKPAKYHDLTLLRLAKHVAITPEASPICLYTSTREPSETLTVTGWGASDVTRFDRSNVLLKANVSVVDRSDCGKKYQYQTSRTLPQGVTNDQICAGDPAGRTDTCQGDSGGPLQGLTSNDGYYRLIGVTSFGRGCGSTTPGIYIRVSRYLDWIERVVWPNNPY